MARFLAASLSLSPPLFPFPSKFNPLSFPSSIVLLPKPRFISAPIAITGAKNSSRESKATIAIDSDFDEDEEFDEEFVEEEDDAEEFIPLKDMRNWERNKPPGFGQGKAYDTTIEEKLLEEMERERADQLAADEKKKAKASSNKKQEQQQPQKKGPVVRLGNLPKKKNIQRDLQAAFKGFNGIVSISPAVTGNRKTRDPICKGFAFVEFASEKTATR